MAKKSKSAKKKYSKLDRPRDWRDHDTYTFGVSADRIVTRSQTAFLRIKNTKSDLELFADPSKHQPPGMPHVMEALKGKYGSIPRTLITRSTGQHLSVSSGLCKKLEPYKNYKPGQSKAAPTSVKEPTKEPPKEKPIAAETSKERIKKEPAETSKEPVKKVPSETSKEPIKKAPSETSKEPIKKEPAETSEEPVEEPPAT